MFFRIYLFSALVFFVHESLASEVVSNLWAIERQNDEGGVMTITAVMLDIKHPPADFNTNAPDGTDDHGYGLDTNRELRAKFIFHTPQKERPGVKFSAGYFRGSFYDVPKNLSSFAATSLDGTDDVSIFSNRDKSELIVALDNGLTYVSTNFGMTWQGVKTPGPHEFSLAKPGEDGGFCAHILVGNSTNLPAADWYLIATSADGSKIVASANSSQPAPSLTIRTSSNGVVITWPSQFQNYVLEQSTSISDAKWQPVDSPVGVYGTECRVSISIANGNNFFRLRTH
jgi:hypothetical protein